MSNKIKTEMTSRRIQKRSDIDIIASISNEAHKGCGKTRIMYRCNLSHKQLQIYLKLLVGMGFLASHSDKGGNEKGLFKTTTKGLRFLNAYRSLKALMT